MLFLGLILAVLAVLVATVAVFSCITLKRKFAKESTKTPSVSTLIRRFDAGESKEPAGTTVTSLPRRVQTKAGSHHIQSASLPQNKHMTGAPPRSPSPYRTCAESSRGYEPPIQPNEREHSYRESITSEHLYIELTWWEIFLLKVYIVVTLLFTFVCSGGSRICWKGAPARRSWVWGWRFQVLE